MYKTREGNLIFIRIPKTASTSVVRALQKKYPDLERVGRVDHKMSWEVPPEVFEGFDVITVVRSPLDWLRSLHQSIMEGKTSKQKMLLIASGGVSPDPLGFVNQLRYTQRDWYRGLRAMPRARLDAASFKMFPLTQRGIELLEDEIEVKLDRDNITKMPDWYIKVWERAAESQLDEIAANPGILDDAITFRVLEEYAKKGVL